MTVLRINEPYKGVGKERREVFSILKISDLIHVTLSCFRVSREFKIKKIIKLTNTYVRYLPLEGSVADEGCEIPIGGRLDQQHEG